MNIKNLKRAGEIAEQLPELKRAREILADPTAQIKVSTMLNSDNERVYLPRSVFYNVINVLNVEINKLESEIKNL
jgi:hypothetical protein